jgi:hypothetical protein
MSLMSLPELLLVLFEDASFSRDVRAVLASVVLPDCKAVPRDFSNDAILDTVVVELSVELLLVLAELSGGGGP